MKRAFAPGKIILTGEHSVVYGCPALAVAIKQGITLAFSENQTNSFSWEDPINGTPNHWTAKQLITRAEQLDQRHANWQAGLIDVNAVLDCPSDLLAYTLAYIIKSDQINYGDLSWQSDLPIGAGMGSSAAVIAGLIRLISADLTAEVLTHQVRHCERLQHGKSSLIDSATISMGSAIKVINKGLNFEQLNQFALDDDWYWIFSGTPASSTGQCVAEVAKYSAKSDIWQAFTAVSEAFCKASQDEYYEIIKANHRLLISIGVVPQAIQQIISNIEKCGGAAKISGAGSIEGDQAGLLLARFSPDNATRILHSLPSTFRWGKIQQEYQGARKI